MNGGRSISKRTERYLLLLYGAFLWKIAHLRLSIDIFMLFLIWFWPATIVKWTFYELVYDPKDAQLGLHQSVSLSLSLARRAARLLSSFLFLSVLISSAGLIQVFNGDKEKESC